MSDLRLTVSVGAGWESAGLPPPAAAMVDGMRADDIWNDETARHYDTPGTGMFAAETLDPTVDRLVALADGGPALEFAVGTGRVAVPLAARGVPVTGIELSRPMLRQLRTKATAQQIPVIVGDMATATAPGRYRLVYLVYNTISNLLSQAEQVACFRNAARHLVPGGRFVVELEVPQLRTLPPGREATVFHADDSYVGLDTYDLLSQHLVSHHFRIDGKGQVSLFRSPHRYVWPAEMDLMAQLAGLELESRHADWSGAEFTAESPAHVSVYRLPGGDVSAGTATTWATVAAAPAGLHPDYPVRTERLLLRPLTAADVDDLLSYRSRPEVCRYVPFAPMTRDDVVARLATMWANTGLTDDGQALTLGIEVAATGRLIGDVVLFWHSRAQRGGEIGYVVHPDASGQGYATEAARALLGLGFDQLGLHRIVARIDERNTPSARLARRLGMRQEARLVRNDFFKGEWSTELDFAMLADEWPAYRDGRTSVRT
ncbi:GNAT family N-acetyltransferase [Solwaraspora sp. WMMA2101]|uniref:GNAT family N-acetyltransferase n=1 Tax=Solwaraspora sp. WMMA2101 TaxID=3404124 RepID=UPI003B93AD84